jgi:hypothetical protein
MSLKYIYRKSLYNFFIVIHFFTVIIISLSCKDNPVTHWDENSTTHLIPLKVGNFWVYASGTKVTGGGDVDSEIDTLKVILQNEKGYLLQSRLEFVMPNGYYSNRADGLYREDRLQFKYPSEIGELSGDMFLYDKRDVEGLAPQGYLSRNNYTHIYTPLNGKADTLENCDYYFLPSFYQSDSVQTTGYTVFKPGIGIVLSDWAHITQTENRYMYNYFGLLRDFHINN